MGIRSVLKAVHELDAETESELAVCDVRDEVIHANMFSEQLKTGGNERQRLYSRGKSWGIYTCRESHRTQTVCVASTI
jgi:hypothetical protein